MPLLELPSDRNLFADLGSRLQAAGEVQSRATVDSRAEEMLREVAFVLHLTHSVKQSLTQE